MPSIASWLDTVGMRAFSKQELISQDCTLPVRDKIGSLTGSAKCINTMKSSCVTYMWMMNYHYGKFYFGQRRPSS